MYTITIHNKAGHDYTYKLFTAAELQAAIDVIKRQAWQVAGIGIEWTRRPA